MVEPILILLAMGWGLGAYIGLVDGQKYIEFIAPGIIASYAMFSASFECTYGSFVRMEYQKTFDAIIATPLNVEDVYRWRGILGGDACPDDGHGYPHYCRCFRAGAIALGAGHTGTCFYRGSHVCFYCHGVYVYCSSYL